MSKKEFTQELITGYSKGFITDVELGDMLDLTLNTVRPKVDNHDYDYYDACAVTCSAELDNEWANESENIQ